MKPPKPKTPSGKKDDSGSVWSERNFGKALDAVKQGSTMASSVASVFNEVEKTKQKQIDARVEITKSHNETDQAFVRANVDLARVARDIGKNVDDHEAEMKRIDNQHDLAVRESDRRDRIIDKLLENPNSGNADALVSGLRATMLPNGGHRD